DAHRNHPRCRHGGWLRGGRRRLPRNRRTLSTSRRRRRRRDDQGCRDRSRHERAGRDWRSRVSDNKPNRRELLRPLHLLGIALVCGVFAAGVTLVSTGAFTTRVTTLISNGSYEGLTPI